MYNYYNNKKIAWIVITVLIFIVIVFFIYNFFFKKNAKNNENISIDQKNISSESKEILHKLEKYKKEKEEKNSDKDNNNKEEESYKKKISKQIYKPKNGVDGRIITKEQRQIIDSPKLKSAEELKITEGQRVYVLRALIEPRLIFDEYYTGEEYAKNFKNPEEYNKVKNIVFQDYLNAFYSDDPNGAQKIFDKISEASLEFLREESKKYKNGKNSEEIKKAAKEFDVDWNKI